MPFPWVAASTGDQRIGRHGFLLPALDGDHERGDVSERDNIDAPFS
jgi:hypothetical protein